MHYKSPHIRTYFASFIEPRCSILAGVNVNDVFEACGYSEGSDINILQLLLYGNKTFLLEANKFLKQNALLESYWNP